MKFDVLYKSIIEEDDLSREDRINLLKKNNNLLVPGTGKNFKVIAVTACRGLDVDNVTDKKAANLEEACESARAEYIEDVRLNAHPDEEDEVEGFIEEYIDPPVYNYEEDIGSFSTGEESMIIVIGDSNRYFDSDIEEEIYNIYDLILYAI